MRQQAVLNNGQSYLCSPTQEFWIATQTQWIKAKVCREAAYIGRLQRPREEAKKH